MSKDRKSIRASCSLPAMSIRTPRSGWVRKRPSACSSTGDHRLCSSDNLKTDGPDGGKAQMIRGIINQYRDGARRQLLEESPKLQNQVDQMREQMQALKMPQ